MSINASNNFNLNITWSIGSKGEAFHAMVFYVIFQNKMKSQKKDLLCEIVLAEQSKYSF